ncbi:cache domain-containing protein [Paludibacterium denitrificans]|uniref:cache domain-containing protein n=1 Tax=Paludibacterium denitrificans TaxID=2675226 RepID=UPI00247824EF|nr:cache domain-containing protein [Paludibacterium denitrificans]
MTRAMQSGGGKGFVEYVWDKPGFEQPQSKISYAMVTPRWKWVIGTGIYLDDVAAAFQQELITLALEIGVALLLLGMAGVLILRSVLGQLGADPRETVAVVKKIAEGWMKRFHSRRVTTPA